MNPVITYFSIFSLTLFSCGVKPNESQNEQRDTAVTYTATPAPEWMALFNRTTGWFGGDGIFAIPFSGIRGSAKELVAARIKLEAFENFVNSFKFADVIENKQDLYRPRFVRIPFDKK